MREFDIFKNTDDMTVEAIANEFPVLTAEERERMFAMSERKFNITEKRFPQGEMNNNDDYDIDVDGVEEYDRPAWLRYLSTAAALMLLGAGLAFGHNLLKRRPTQGPDIDTPPVVATEITTGTSLTTGADNSKYTTKELDIDALLVTTATAAATDAPAATEAPTAAPTAAPTEAPTTEAAPTPDINAYKEIAKTLEKKWLNIKRYNGDYYGTRQMDINDTVIVYLAYDDGINADAPVVYARIYDYGEDIHSVEDYNNYYNSVFSAETEIFRDTAGYIEPEGRYSRVPTIAEYNGALYHIYRTEYADIIEERVKGYPADSDISATWAGWDITPEGEYDMIGDTDVIIENASMDSFDAIIPVCFYSPYGDLQSSGNEYDDNNHNYRIEKWHFINENGQWKIHLSPYDSREYIPYPDYIAKLNAQ